MTSPFPLNQLLVAFNNGPLDDLSTFILDAPGVAPSAGHWTDLSQWFISANITRGRQHELQQFEAGTLVAPLGNRLGEFNPWGSGQFSSYLTPGVVNAYGGIKLPVRLRQIWPGAQLLTPDQQAPGDIAGWSFSTGVASASAGTLILTGPIGGGDTAGFTINTIPGAPSQTYTAAATFATTSTVRAVHILIDYFGSAGLIRTDTVATVDSNVGVTLTYSGTSPAGTTRVRMWLDVLAQAAGEQHTVKNISFTGPLVVTKFTGHATAWRTTWPDAISTWAQLEASDAFRYFNDQQIGTNSTYTSSIAGFGFGHYWRCNDPSGSTTLADTGTAPAAAVLQAGGGSLPRLGGAGPLLAQVAGSGSVSLGSAVAGLNGDYVDVTGAGLSGAGSFTLIVWFQVPTGDVTGYLGGQHVPSSGSNANSWKWTITNGQQQFTLVSGIATATLTGAIAVNDSDWHMAAVTFNSGSTFAQMYMDGQADGFPAALSGALSLTAANTTLFGAAAPTFAEAGLNLSEIGMYAGLLTAAQILALYTAGIVFVPQSTDQRLQSALGLLGWPANLQQLDTGVQQCQGNNKDLTTTTYLTHMQDVERTEEGALFMTGAGVARFISRQNLATVAPFAAIQCWFGDEVAAPPPAGWDVGTWDGTFAWGTLDLPFEPGPSLALDDIDITTGATVTRDNGLAQNAGAGSAARVQSFTGVLHLSDPCSLAHAQWVVAKLAAPAVRLSKIMVSLGDFLNDVEGVARVLRLDLMSRISVERTQVGFTQVGVIEQIAEQITPESDVITYALSVADTFSAWTWGGAQ